MPASCGAGFPDNPKGYPMTVTRQSDVTFHSHTFLGRDNRPRRTFSAECACGWHVGPVQTAGLVHGAIGRHLGLDDTGNPTGRCEAHR